MDFDDVDLEIRTYIRGVKKGVDYKELEATKSRLLEHRDKIAQSFFRHMSPKVYHSDKAMWKSNWNESCAVIYLSNVSGQLQKTIMSKPPADAFTFQYIFKSLFLPLVDVEFTTYAHLGVPAMPNSDWNIDNREVFEDDIRHWPDHDLEDEFVFVAIDSGCEPGLVD